MPSTLCDCGHRIGTGSFPNPNVYSLWSEAAYDSIHDPVERPALEHIFFNAPLVLQCAACGRLHINWRDGRIITYSPAAASDQPPPVEPPEK